MKRFVWVLAAAACVPPGLSSSSSSTTPPAGTAPAQAGPPADTTGGAPANDALLPDPAPPAHRDPSGTIVGPGGAISSDPRECGPAQNHCLRGNAWFGTGFDGPAGVHSPAAAVFAFDGHYYAYNGEKCENTVYRTRPATAENIEHARLVWVYVSDQEHGATIPAGTIMSMLPRSEHDALSTRRWSMISVASIDAKAGTFVADDSFTYQIAAARIGFDPRAAE